MITKLAMRLYDMDSPGHAIYNMMRTYRRGARNGVTLAPIVNDEKKNKLEQDMKRASDKLDRLKELKEQNAVKILPEQPII